MLNKKVLIGVFIIAVVVGGIIFLSKKPNDKNLIQPKKILTKQQNVHSVQPKNVVLAYMKSTLGTLPDSFIDYEIAKEFLSENLAQQFKDPSFIPTSYGIQQGPDKVEIADESINNNSAKVIVNAFYGEEIGLSWTFYLEEDEDGLWKITKIENEGK